MKITHIFKIFLVLLISFSLCGLAEAKTSGSRGFSGGKSSFGSSRSSGSTFGNSYKSTSSSTPSKPFSFFSNSKSTPPPTPKQNTSVTPPPSTAFQQAKQQETQATTNKSAFSNFFNKKKPAEVTQTNPNYTRDAIGNHQQVGKTTIINNNKTVYVERSPRWDERRSYFRSNYRVPYYYNPSRYSNYGSYDSFFLGYMLSDTFNDLGRFFYNHSTDPDVIRWKADLYREAQNNSELRARLNLAERQINELQVQKAIADQNYIPPGIDKDIAMVPEVAPTVQPQNQVATAKTNEEESGSSFLGTLVVITLLGGLGWYVFVRKTL